LVQLNLGGNATPQRGAQEPSLFAIKVELTVQSVLCPAKIDRIHQ
jgi:hypothetical protein